MSRDTDFKGDLSQTERLRNAMERKSICTSLHPHTAKDYTVHIWRADCWMGMAAGAIFPSQPQTYESGSGDRNVVIIVQLAASLIFI